MAATAQGQYVQEMSFSQENKGKSSIFEVDKISLKKDEKARILLLDKNPKMAYVHYVRAGAQPNKDTGEIYGRWFVCLGQYEVVKAQGIDPANCPFCENAEDIRDAPVGWPRRRFVLHVARYRTTTQGAVLTPVSLALQVWLFADDKFNKLVDRAAEHGDLNKRDIILTCTSAQYQNYDMDVSGRIAALDPQLSPAQQQASVEQIKTLKAARRDDVDKLLGQRISPDEARKLLANPTPEIRDEDAVFAAASESAIDDVLSALDDEPAAAPAAAAPAPAPAAAPAAPAAEVEDLAPEVAPSGEVDFASLLDD